ncbi:zinc finger protein 250-like [Nerophis ophidion]|uniref:zinc finger protein 250-like n=1 Tax=Nerophis ophidion TaxID=159077 RepID=UPI002AE0613A|nr:zinc finger protein 250-like [Nerophis ophidion]
MKHKKLVNIEKTNCLLAGRTSTDPASAAMTNYLSTAFRAQITTTMDTVLRCAVLEITEVFDQCMRDYCRELTAKDEMIALLEMKLQKREHLLKDGDGRDARAAGHTTKCEGEDKEALGTSSQTSCEMPFEVPAECSLEDVTKDSSNVCPVRLRKLSIPLQPCPLPLSKSKHSKNGTKKGFLLKKSPKHSEDRLVTKGERQRHLPGRKCKRLLRDDNEEESLDPAVKTSCGRSERRLSGEEQQHLTVKQVKEDKTKSERRLSGEEQQHLTVQQVKEDKTKSERRLSGEEQQHLTVQQVKEDKTKSERRLSGEEQQHLTVQQVKEEKTKSERRLSGEEQQHPAGDKTAAAESERSLTVEQVKGDKTTELDLMWMAPIEDPEELELSNGPSRGADCNWAPNKVQSKVRWQDMGEQRGSNFICSVCRKQLLSRSALIGHFRIHMGERPVHCHRCPMAFRTPAQLCRHNKSMHPARKPLPS